MLLLPERPGRRASMVRPRADAGAHREVTAGRREMRNSPASPVVFLYDAVRAPGVCPASEAPQPASPTKEERSATGLPQDSRGGRPPDPPAVPRHPGGGDGARVPQPVLEQPRARHLRGRRLGPAAVRVDRQVRQPFGLAELHPAHRARRRHREGRPDAVDEAHRGALVRRRQPPRPRLRRRPDRGRWSALLHELRRDAVRARLAARGRGLRAVPLAVPDHDQTTTTDAAPAASEKEDAS